MTRQIDYDRGVMINQEAVSGIDVFMYFDEPGKYLNVHGIQVSEAFAARAGFDIKRWGAERKVRDTVEEYEKQVREKLANPGGEKVIVAEKDGFKVVDIGLGRHVIEGPDGLPLTGARNRLTGQEALAVFEGLTGWSPPVQSGAGDSSGDGAGSDPGARPETTPEPVSLKPKRAAA